jgi:hypothetical protein
MRKSLLSLVTDAYAVPLMRNETQRNEEHNREEHKTPTTTHTRLLVTRFHVGFLLGLFFDLEDGGDMFLRNIR